MKVSTRTRLLTILCVLLFVVTAMWFCTASAGAEENESSDALTVEAIGWGEPASNAAANGCASIDEKDRVEFQIWFSDAIHSENAVNLVNTDAGLSMDVVQSALQYIEINGKTLGAIVTEITAASGTTTVQDGLLGMHIQGGSKNFQFNFKKSIQSVADKYAALPDCYLNVEKDSPYRLTEANTITIRAGFTAMGKTIAEDVTFVYNPPVDSSNGRWVEDKAEELKITSVESYISGGTETVIKLSVDSPLVNESIVHAARDSEATVLVVNNQEKLDLIKANGLRYSIWNKLAINGETIRQMITKNSELDSGDWDGELDVHLRGGTDGNKIEIRIKTTSAAAVELKDGLTVSVLSGFRSDLGKFSESVAYVYNEAEGLWTEGGSTIVREELSVNKVTGGISGDHYSFNIYFNQDINSSGVNFMARENEAVVAAQNSQEILDHIKANGLRTSVWDNIKIGDHTIKELMALAAEHDSGDTASSVDVHLREPNRMEIEIKTASYVAVDENSALTLTILKGFKSDRVIASENIVYNRVNGTWYAEGEEPPVQKETSIVNVYQTIGENDIEIYVVFDGPLNKESVIHMARENFGTVQAVNPGKADNIKANGLYDSVREKVVINGKTLKELMASVSAEDAVDVHINDSAENNIMRIVLKKAYGFVDFNENIILTVKEGFHSDIAVVSEDIVYTYSSSAGIWLAPGETAPSFDAVTLIGINAPDMTSASENKNVQFLLKFSENIDTRQHAYISTDKDLAAALAGSNYSASELTSFTKFSVFSTMATHILLNGKSIKDMIDESGWAYAQSPNVATIHSCFEGTGLNTLRLVIGGEYPQTDATILHNPFQINDLNQNFVITVKAGLRTPLGQEVKEDISFIYDPVSQTWYEGDSVEDIPVYVTVTFQDGETVISTQQCFAGETVVAGVARKEGYTFDGWYTDAALTQEWDSSAPVNEDITVYAKFTKNTSSGGEDSCESCGSVTMGGSSLTGSILVMGLALVLAVVSKRRKCDK